MDARAEILARIARTTPSPIGATPRDYRGVGETACDDVVALFAERVDEYRASVRRCTADEVEATVAELVGRRRVVVPSGLPFALDGTPESDSLTADHLDELDGVVTTCAVAIALTGTVVLDHREGQGRRALTLVPDWHLVVVRAEQIVAGVPDAVAALDPTRPMTWISGPSATSDIELERVEGVHGPRTLVVLVVDAAAQRA